MHVAVVSTFYPNAAEPVRAVFVRSLTAALSRHCMMIVVAPVPYAPPVRHNRRWLALRSIPKTASDGRVQVLHPRYVAIPKCDPLSGFTYFAGIAATLRRLCRDRQIDLLHVHCAFPDAVGVALAAAWLGIPFAVTTHGSDINVYAQEPLIRRQLTWALERAAVVIAVSEALQRKIRGLVPSLAERVVHIPCAGVDPRLFTPRDREGSRRSLGLAGDGRIVLFVGRLVAIKAVDVLLEAWRELCIQGKAGRRDRLVIIGEGPLRRSLEARAASGALHGAVRFMGDMPQEEIARWMNAANALCLPSRNEGTPAVMTEALASGCPVVASRVGGIPEVISSGRNGLLVEPGDSERLAEALSTALERHWNIGEIARSVSELTWDRLAERNLRVLRDVVAERRVGAARVH
jgi:glycosyltransferase involved in cell wall biosynthesis